VCEKTSDMVSLYPLSLAASRSGCISVPTPAEQMSFSASSSRGDHNLFQLCQRERERENNSENAMRSLELVFERESRSWSKTRINHWGTHLTNTQFSKRNSQSVKVKPAVWLSRSENGDENGGGISTTDTYVEDQLWEWKNRLSNQLSNQLSKRVL